MSQSTIFFPIYTEFYTVLFIVSQSSRNRQKMKTIIVLLCCALTFVNLTYGKSFYLVFTSSRLLANHVKLQFRFFFLSFLSVKLFEQIFTAMFKGQIKVNEAVLFVFLYFHWISKNVFREHSILVIFCWALLSLLLL